MMKTKEIRGRTLTRPLMPRTAPPPLSCQGSDACSGYFSTPLCKYKIRRTEEIMPDSCRSPFTSWREDEEKRKPGLSINKQGTPAIMLFPAAEPIPSLKHAPGRQPGPGKQAVPPAGKNRPSFGIPFPALFPEKPQIMAQRQRIRLAAFLPAMLFCHLRFPRLAQFHPGEPFKHLF